MQISQILTLSVAIISIVYLVIPSESYEQVNTTSLEEQLKGAAKSSVNPHFEEKLKQELGNNYAADLQILYQSPTMVVIRGNLLTANPIPGIEGASRSDFNHNFWQGIEILKRDYGFNIDKFVVNGIGSDVNPETFYAIMIK